MTDTYVLRKSIEGYSAGTRVYPETEYDPEKWHRITVHVHNDNYIFEVALTDLVKRRPRTTYVPVNARKRREAKKAARREKNAS